MAAQSCMRVRCAHGAPNNMCAPNIYFLRIAIYSILMPKCYVCAYYIDHHRCNHRTIAVLCAFPMQVSAHCVCVLVLTTLAPLHSHTLFLSRSRSRSRSRSLSLSLSLSFLNGYKYNHIAHIKAVTTTTTTTATSES